MALFARFLDKAVVPAKIMQVSIYITLHCLPCMMYVPAYVYKRLTRIFVNPAYFLFGMQQEQILGELYWYTHQDSPPADVSSVSETLKYLESCSQLFEKGFLSHNKITVSEVLENIDKGYSYFSEWLSSILKKGLHSE